METKRVARRKHSAELRAQVVQACREVGASVAAIALRNGLNANLVHRWLREDGRSLPARGGTPTTVSAPLGVDFVPLQMPASATAAAAGASSDIRVELRRGTSTITVSWPLQGSRDCAAWLREWLR